MIQILEDVTISNPIDVMDYIEMDINGISYKFVPKSDSPFDVSTLVQKVNGIRKYSQGKALAFLKKHAIGTKVIGN